MNEHLLPVLNIILPRLYKRKIPFWVYGGMAIAGVKGEFLRENADVDTFVEEKYFREAKEILIDLCRLHSDWKLRSHLPERGIRPKIDILIEGREVFSLVPVFRENDKVKLVFPIIGVKIFSIKFLTPVKRKLNDYEFITPPDIFLSDLFYLHYNLLKSNSDVYIRHLEKYKYDKEFLDSLKLDKLTEKNDYR